MTLGTYRPATTRDWFFGDLPKTWSYTTLKYACALSSVYGANIPAEDYSETGVRFIRTTDVTEDGKLLPGGVFITEESAVGYILQNNDFLVSRSGTVGRGFLYSEAYGRCAYAGYLVRFLLKPEFLPKFLFYVTKSKGFQRWIGTVSIEATIGNVNGEKYANFSFPAPLLETQHLIVDYLDRETARIDALVAEKEHMLALLEEKRAALISSKVTRGLNPDAPRKPSGLDWLGDIPAHWGVCQLKRTWASSDYGLSESIRDEGEVAVLRMSCIVDGRIDVTKAGTITEADEYLLLRRNDLLFNRTNSLDQVAKVGIVDFDPDSPLTFASYLVRIRVNNRATPGFLVYLLNSRYFLNFARKNAIPAIGQANLSPTRYGEIRIPLPPVDEQESILRFLDEDSQLSNPIRNGIQCSIDLLKERRAALVTAAVTGKITPEEMAG